MHKNSSSYCMSTGGIKFKLYLNCFENSFYFLIDIFWVLYIVFRHLRFIVTFNMNYFTVKIDQANSATLITILWWRLLSHLLISQEITNGLL